MVELRFKIFKSRQQLCNFVNNNEHSVTNDFYEMEHLVDNIVQIVETTENGSSRFVLYYLKNI